MSCSKTVVDFTLMSPEEIQQYIITNQGHKMCGRFKKSQLDSITIQIPSKVLYTQTHFHKMFLLALFIAMGTTLFSCQNKEGNKQKIEKIEIIENSLSPKTESNKEQEVSATKPTTVSKTKYKKASTLKNKKYLSLVKTECAETLPNEDIYEDNTVYGSVAIDVIPDYPGGKDVFYEAFKSEFKIPKELKKSTGVIKMSFVIEKDGSLNEIKTIEDLGFGTGEEAIRVLQKSIKWTPGEIQGRKVRTFYNLPITLELDTLNPKKRKRKFSKITTMQIVKTGDSQEQTELSLQP